MFELDVRGGVVTSICFVVGGYGSVLNESSLGVREIILQGGACER
jgi:hypothetical protein